MQKKMNLRPEEAPKLVESPRSADETGIHLGDFLRPDELRRTGVQILKDESIDRFATVAVSSTITSKLTSKSTLRTINR